MLINLRNALMAGKRLPYDAEIEFLESTGTQWIDTGYSFNSATDKVELVFELLTTTPNYKWIFGAYDTKRFAIGSGDSTDRRTFGYNASTSYNSSTYYTNGAHNFLADSTGASIDGHSFFGFADFSTTSHIILYSIPIDTSTYCSNSRIWSYKHYRNGVLVRDFIPVRKGTVGYLYDRVSGKLFGNAGTGDFVLVPDVVPVEYIESHGTEWIDTGVIPDDTSGYFVRCSANSVGGNKVPCGQREDRGNTRWYVNFSSSLEFSWNSYHGVDAYNANTWYDIGFNWMNSRTGTKDGSTVFNISQQLTTRTRTAYVFANHFTSGAANLFAGKIASLKISQGTTSIRSFFPIRVGTDATSWEGAMMDVLTRRIYRNRGTGAFGYGSDLDYPIPAE